MRSDGAQAPHAPYTAAQRTETAAARRGGRGPEPHRSRRAGHLLEAVVAVVHAEVGAAGQEPRHARALTQAVVVADRRERLPGEERGEQHPGHAEVRQSAVVHLYLNQATYLAVDHAIELRYQDNLVAVVAVLGKELYPVHAGRAALLPGAGVKNQLGFVYHEQNFILLDLPPLEMRPGRFIEHIWGQVVIRDVPEQHLVVPQLRVNVKVANNRTFLP